MIITQPSLIKTH